MQVELVTPMTNLVVADADARWRAWQAEGVDDDRRRGRMMGSLIVAIAVALAVNLVLQLVWRT